MEIPFEIGSRYRNRNGEYEVLSIDGDQMTIRYDDGSMQQVGVDLQAKIWRNMEDEEKKPGPGIRKSDRSSEDSQATAPIREFVETVLRARFQAPFPQDITDQVCLAIEANEVWLKQYWSLVEHFSSGGKKGRDVVNNFIGVYSKDLTGMIVTKYPVVAKSTLIKTYSQLGYAE